MRAVISSTTCDWCHEERDFENDEQLFAAGWIAVYRGEDPEDCLDFCCPACVVSYFS